MTPAERAVAAALTRVPEDGPEFEDDARMMRALGGLHLDLPLRELRALAAIACETAREEQA